jgi:hypothetical protein
MNFIFKYKFLLISLVSFSVPYLEFINFNFASIDSYFVKTLSYTIIFFILLSFLFSFIIAFFFNKNFFEIFYLCSLTIFFFFNYDKLKLIIAFLLKKTSYQFMGELSVILILLLSICITIFFEKIKKSWFINFLNIYIIIF